MSDLLWGQNYFAGQISLMVSEQKDTTVSKTLWSSLSYEATQNLCSWTVLGMDGAAPGPLLVDLLAGMNTPQLPMHFPKELGALVLRGG